MLGTRTVRPLETTVDDCSPLLLSVAAKCLDPFLTKLLRMLRTEFPVRGAGNVAESKLSC